MNTRIQIMDIETLKSCYTVTFLDYMSDKYVQFQINKYQNDWIEVCKQYKNVHTLITFNGIHFDNVVMNWLVDQKFHHLTGEEIAIEIYKVAQATIYQDKDFDSFRAYLKYKFQKLHQREIDIFAYWSKMLRMSKKLSLKAFEASMGMSIEEMPIHHTQEELTQEEIKLILGYYTMPL